MIIDPAGQTAPYRFYGKPVCSICGDIGHDAAEGCSTPYCSNCGKYGHATGESCSTACITCGRHHKNRAPDAPCFSDQCGICGMFGHAAPKCPVQLCQSCRCCGHSSTDCRACHLCGGHDHIAPRCPLMQQQQQQQPQPFLPQQQQQPQQLLPQQQLQQLLPQQPQQQQPLHMMYGGNSVPPMASVPVAVPEPVPAISRTGSSGSNSSAAAAARASQLHANAPVFTPSAAPPPPPMQPAPIPGGAVFDLGQHQVLLLPLPSSEAEDNGRKDQVMDALFRQAEGYAMQLLDSQAAPQLAALSRLQPADLAVLLGEPSPEVLLDMFWQQYQQRQQQPQPQQGRQQESSQQAAEPTPAEAMRLLQQQQRDKQLHKPKQQAFPGRETAGPCELSPDAAAVFEQSLPHGMLPSDWQQFVSWGELDTKVCFTVGGTGAEVIKQNMSKYKGAMKAAVAAAAAQARDAAGGLPVRSQSSSSSSGTSSGMQAPDKAGPAAGGSTVAFKVVPRPSSSLSTESCGRPAAQTNGTVAGRASSSSSDDVFRPCNVPLLKPLNGIEGAARQQQFLDTLLATPAAAEYAKWLQEPGQRERLSVLCRLAPADLAKLLQQRKPEQLLEQVYKHRLNTMTGSMPAKPTQLNQQQQEQRQQQWQQQRQQHDDEDYADAYDDEEEDEYEDAYGNEGEDEGGYEGQQEQQQLWLPSGQPVSEQERQRLYAKWRPNDLPSEVAALFEADFQGRLARNWRSYTRWRLLENDSRLSGVGRKWSKKFRREKLRACMAADALAAGSMTSKQLQLLQQQQHAYFALPNHLPEDIAAAFQAEVQDPLPTNWRDYHRWDALKRAVQFSSEKSRQAFSDAAATARAAVKELLASGSHPFAAVQQSYDEARGRLPARAVQAQQHQQHQQHQQRVSDDARPDTPPVGPYELLPEYAAEFVAALPAGVLPDDWQQYSWRKLEEVVAGRWKCDPIQQRNVFRAARNKARDATLAAFKPQGQQQQQQPWQAEQQGSSRPGTASSSITAGSAAAQLERQLQNQQQQLGKRIYAPNELSREAADAFVATMPPDSLPLDWYMFDKWSTLDAHVSFTKGGSTVHDNRMRYLRAKQQAQAATAAAAAAGGGAAGVTSASPAGSSSSSSMNASHPAAAAAAPAGATLFSDAVRRVLVPAAKPPAPAAAAAAGVAAGPAAAGPGAAAAKPGEGSSQVIISSNSGIAVVPRSSASSSTSVTRASSSGPVVSISGRSSSSAAGVAVDSSTGRRSSSSSGVLGVQEGEGDGGPAYIPFGKPVCSKCGAEGHRALHCSTPYCGSCETYGHAEGYECVRACFKCGRYHPRLAPGAQCPDFRCNECGLWGHKASSCPTLKCNFCSCYGHTASQCKACSECRQHGHKAAACPGFCTKCKKPGHKTSECRVVICGQCGQPGHVVGSDQCPAVSGNSSSASSAAATAGKGKRKGKGAATAAAAAAAAPAGYDVTKLQPVAAEASAAEAERRIQGMMETLLLSPAEGYAAQLLDEGGDKVGLLSRIAAADLKVLLQQPQPEQLLEQLYQHFKQLQEQQQQQQAAQQPGQQQQANGGSSMQQHGPPGQSTIQPCDLLPESAAAFEKSLQAAPGVMPASWQEFDSWRQLEELFVTSDKHVLVRSLGDRRAHFRQRRLAAQRATQLEATAAQRRQENWPGAVVHQQQQGEQQQQELGQAAEEWPAVQQQQQQQLQQQHNADDFWPAETQDEEQQQQQGYAVGDGAAGHSRGNGPLPASGAPQVQQPGMLGEVPAVQQQQQQLLMQQGLWDPSMQQQQFDQQQFDQQPPRPLQAQQHFQQQQQPPGEHPAGFYQQQQHPGMHVGMLPPHMHPPQQQQQHFMPLHMQPPSMQQQEQQQRRKFAPNELSPAAAAAFEGCLPPDMLPLDWRQMNSWFSLDARVKFTVNGTEPDAVQNTKQFYAALKQQAITKTAAELHGQAGPQQQLQPPPGHVMPAAALPMVQPTAQPTSVYVTGLAGSRPPQQQQQQHWLVQQGHPAAGQDYSQQQQQQHGANYDDGQDDDDLDEMLGLLNVNK